MKRRNYHKFENGDPVGLDGNNNASEILGKLNSIAGDHGIGRLDL